MRAHTQQGVFCPNLKLKYNTETEQRILSLATTTSRLSVLQHDFKTDLGLETGRYGAVLIHP
jgi:hypothetical protein